MIREFVCEWCTTTFVRDHIAGRHPKTCGDECHRARAAARTAEWQRNNPERAKQLKRETWGRYYPRHRDRLIAASTEWARRNPDKKRSYNAKRYALTRGSVGPGEHFTVDQIFERDWHVCHLCGCGAAREQATMDHVIPVACGGAHSLANVRLAHRSCNSSRKTMPVAEWKARHFEKEPIYAA